MGYCLPGASDSFNIVPNAHGKPIYHICLLTSPFMVKLAVACTSPPCTIHGFLGYFLNCCKVAKTFVLVNCEITCRSVTENMTGKLEYYVSTKASAVGSCKSSNKENNPLVSIVLSITEPMPAASPKVVYWVSVRTVHVNACAILTEGNRYVHY